MPSDQPGDWFVEYARRSEDRLLAMDAIGLDMGPAGRKMVEVIKAQRAASGQPHLTVVPPSLEE